MDASSKLSIVGVGVEVGGATELSLHRDRSWDNLNNTSDGAYSKLNPCCTLDDLDLTR